MKGVDLLSCLMNHPVLFKITKMKFVKIRAYLPSMMFEIRGKTFLNVHRLRPNQQIRSWQRDEFSFSVCSAFCHCTFIMDHFWANVFDHTLFNASCHINRRGGKEDSDQENYKLIKDKGRHASHDYEYNFNHRKGGEKNETKHH